MIHIAMIPVTNLTLFIEKRLRQEKFSDRLILLSNMWRFSKVFEKERFFRKSLTGTEDRSQVSILSCRDIDELNM